VHVVEEGKTRIPETATWSQRRSRARCGACPSRTATGSRRAETVITSIEPVIAPLLDPRAKAEAEAKVAGRRGWQVEGSPSLSTWRTPRKNSRCKTGNVPRSSSRQRASPTRNRDTTPSVILKCGHAKTHAAEFGLQVADYELAQAKATLTQIVTPGSHHCH